MTNKFYQQIQAITKLSVTELNEFLANGKVQSIPAKTLLTKPMMQVDKAYFLKSGIIRHFIIGQKKKEFTKNFIQGPRFMLPSLSNFFLQIIAIMVLCFLTSICTF